MKKLMTMIMVIGVALASQAASFKWVASGITGPDGTGTYSGDAVISAYLKSDTSKTVVYTATKSFDGGAINAVIGDDTLVAGNTYTFFYTITSGGRTFTSAEKSYKANATTTPSLNFASSGEWSAVPEPTSALLMLLGVAGLALRRRRV